MVEVIVDYEVTVEILQISTDVIEDAASGIDLLRIP